MAGLSLGAVCAIRPRSLFSRTLDGVATVMVSAPVYWVGLMAMSLFAHDIGALPVPFAGGQGTYRPLSDDRADPTSSAALNAALLGGGRGVPRAP